MDEYLPEDQDLLDELEKIGPMSTGEATSEKQRKISTIQIKASLRSRKTASDLEKATGRYSLVLIIFTIALVVVAISQFVFDVVNSQHVWIGIGLIALSVFFIGFLFKKLDPEELLKK